MNNKEKIEREIGKTLDQFEQAEKLPPNPYFYTRVQQLIDDKQKKHSVFSTFMKPALLTGLVAFNLVTAIWFFTESEQTYDRQELIQVLASDLKLNTEQNNILSLD